MPTYLACTRPDLPAGYVLTAAYAAACPRCDDPISPGHRIALSDDPGAPYFVHHPGCVPASLLSRTPT